MKKLNILFLFICYSWGCIAQPMKQMIQVSVVPNSENWLYKLGKDAVFTCLAGEANISFTEHKRNSNSKVWIYFFMSILFT